MHRAAALAAEAAVAGTAIYAAEAVDTAIYHAAKAARVAATIDYATRAAAYAAAAAFTDVTRADLKTLLTLNLGKRGEPGEPIRWNDPRLGPLWPDGPPESHVQAEQVCQELEKQLDNLPDPNAPPPDPFLEAQIEDRAWLDQLRGEGKLDKYRGEYVIAAEKQIFSHGRNLAKVHPQAEKKAQAKGIPPKRLVLYFIPG